MALSATDIQVAIEPALLYSCACVCVCETVNSEVSYSTVNALTHTGHCKVLTIIIQYQQKIALQGPQKYTTEERNNTQNKHTETQDLSTKKTINGTTKGFTDLIVSISNDTVFNLFHPFPYDLESPV